MRGIEDKKNIHFILSRLVIFCGAVVFGFTDFSV
jgi:hypothetical protein